MLGLNCFSSQRSRGCGVAWTELFQFPEISRLWCCLDLIVSVPRYIEVVVLLVLNCFIPREVEVVVLLGLNCFSSQRSRGCGVAWTELFQFPEKSRLWCCLD